MIWRSLSHTEFEAIDRATPVVMNIAAVEQHGPHLPVEVDCRIGQHFCDELERLIPNDVLILPQVKVCCSNHHMEFAGTLSVSHTTLLVYLSDILNSVLTHGFRNLFILNSHGGNQAIGRVLIETLGPKVKDLGGLIAFASWWDLAKPALGKLNETGPLGIGHACEFETSLMYLIDASTVREDLISGQSFVSFADWADGGLLQGPRVSLYRTMKDISGGSGTVGNPSKASAKKGREITDTVLPPLLQILADMRAI